MSDQSGGADAGRTPGGRYATQAIQVEIPRSVPLNPDHRVDAFACDHSERVARFLTREGPELIQNRYCSAFVLPNPEDPTDIWGYYTLSPSALVRRRATGSDQKRIPGGVPIPMALIGYMGRHNGAPKGFGKSIIVDAARRIYRVNDLPAWGLMLDSEGGPRNEKLWQWYQSLGFSIAKPDAEGQISGVLYGALKKFIPELN